MSADPFEIGTLVVVVLKARNLPNKRNIGKQDPYCTVRLADEVRRTKAIKRGGQHPEWDEEIRFTLVENAEDELARTANGDEPPPPPPKNGGTPTVKGGKTMRIACYADDPRDPDLIGETTVDLTEALTQGEVDEWFPLSYKNKYAGEVYLEMTFWSNAKPPAKRQDSSSSVLSPHYGGPGSFIPSVGESPSSQVAPHLRQGSNDSHMGFSHSRASSSSIAREDSLPEPLKPSTSLSSLDLYIPPYERTNSRADNATQFSAIDSVTAQLSEFGLSSGRRRESFPPVNPAYATPVSNHSAIGSISSIHSLASFYNSTLASSGFSNAPMSSGFGSTPRPPGFGSTPAPSGFIPPQSPQTPRPGQYTRDSYSAPPEGFVSLSSHYSPGGFLIPTQSSGFVPSQTATPAPFQSNLVSRPAPTPFPQGGFTPQRPAQTPASSGFVTHSTSFSQLPLPPQNPFPLSYPPPSATAPPAPLLASQSFQSFPPPPLPLTHTSTPVPVQSLQNEYQQYPSSSPTHQQIYAAPAQPVRQQHSGPPLTPVTVPPQSQVQQPSLQQFQSSAPQPVQQTQPAVAQLNRPLPVPGSQAQYMQTGVSPPGQVHKLPQVPSPQQGGLSTAQPQSSAQVQSPPTMQCHAPQPSQYHQSAQYHSPQQEQYHQPQESVLHSHQPPPPPNALQQSNFVPPPPPPPPPLQGLQQQAPVFQQQQPWALQSQQLLQQSGLPAAPPAAQTIAQSQQLPPPPLAAPFPTPPPPPPLQSHLQPSASMPALVQHATAVRPPLPVPPQAPNHAPNTAPPQNVTAQPPQHQQPLLPPISPPPPPPSFYQSTSPFSSMHSSGAQQSFLSSQSSGSPLSSIVPAAPPAQFLTNEQPHVPPQWAQSAYYGFPPPPPAQGWQR